MGSCQRSYCHDRAAGLEPNDIADVKVGHEYLPNRCSIRITRLCVTPVIQQNPWRNDIVKGRSRTRHGRKLPDRKVPILDGSGRTGIHHSKTLAWCHNRSVLTRLAHRRGSADKPRAESRFRKTVLRQQRAGSSRPTLVESRRRRHEAETIFLQHPVSVIDSHRIGMSESHPFDFTPVPLRVRRDGWTPERQRRFVDLLASGCGPSEAAQAVGKTKQTAFALRVRPGAEGFCAAWDAAVEYARQRRIAALPSCAAKRALAGVLVPRFYRGRLVSVERRVSDGGLIRLLAQLDRWSAKHPDPLVGELGLDELLDLIAPRAEPPKRRPRRSGSSREDLDAKFASAR